MKRILLLLVFVGFFTSSDCFARSKPVKIKYKNGDSYVGEIIKTTTKEPRDFLYGQIFIIRKHKLRHGEGTMIYANGDRYEGEWLNDYPLEGTMFYANGDRYEGTWLKDKPSNGKLTYVNGDIFTGTFQSDDFSGTLLLKEAGVFSSNHGFEWQWSANCNFEGTIINCNSPGRMKNTKDCIAFQKGQFDCELINQLGDHYIGEILNSAISNGRIEFANGDIFEGTFQSEQPSKGKYFYSNPKEVVQSSFAWTLPADCTFDGDLTFFSGTVDKEIVDRSGNRFIGELQNGQPDHGTMTYANGVVEQGEWHDGMTPSEYKIYLEKKRIEEETKRRREERENLKNFEEYMESNRELLVFYKDPDVSESILRGASVKLAQLYTGKKVIYKGEIYICKKVEFVTENLLLDLSSLPEPITTIKFTISSLNGKDKIVFLNKLLYSTYLPLGKRDFKYPKELTYRYFTCNVKDCSYNLFGDDLYLAADIESAKHRAQIYYTNKFGKYGMAVFNRKIELGMTLEMVQAIIEIGWTSRRITNNREVVIFSCGFSSYKFINNRLVEIIQL